MRKTRDLGMKWPLWRSLLFEEQVAVDMRVVCPPDVKKMLFKQARTAPFGRNGELSTSERS